MFNKLNWDNFNKYFEIIVFKQFYILENKFVVGY